MNRREVRGVPDGPDRGLTRNIHDQWRGEINRKNRMIAIGPRAMFDTAPKNYNYIVAVAWELTAELNNNWMKHYRILYPFGKMDEKSEINIEYHMDDVMAEPTVLGDGIHTAVTMYSTSFTNKITRFSAGIELPIDFEDDVNGKRIYTAIVGKLRQSTWHRMEFMMWEQFHYTIPWHLQWMATFDKQSYVNRAMALFKVTQNRLHLNSVTEGSLAQLDDWVTERETEDDSAPYGKNPTNFWVIAASTAKSVKFDIKRNFQAVTGVWPINEKGEVNMAFVPDDIKSAGGTPIGIQTLIKDEKGRKYQPMSVLYNWGGHYVAKNAIPQTTKHVCNTSGDIKTLKGSKDDMDTLHFRKSFKHAYEIVKTMDDRDGGGRIRTLFGVNLLGQGKFVDSVEETAVTRMAEWLRDSISPPISEQMERDVYGDVTGVYGESVSAFSTFLNSNKKFIEAGILAPNGYYIIESNSANIFIRNDYFMGKETRSGGMSTILGKYIKIIQNWLPEFSHATLTSSHKAKIDLKDTPWDLWLFLENGDLQFTEISKELLDELTAGSKNVTVIKTSTHTVSASAWYLTLLTWHDSLYEISKTHLRPANVKLNGSGMSNLLSAQARKAAYHGKNQYKFLQYINMLYRVIETTAKNIQELVDNGIPTGVNLLYVRPNQTFSVDNAMRSEPGAHEFVMQNGTMDTPEAGSSGEFVKTIWKEDLCFKIVRPKKRFVAPGIKWNEYRFGMENRLMTYDDMINYKESPEISVKEMEESNDTMVFFISPTNDVNKNIVLTSDSEFKSYHFDEWFVENIYSQILRPKFSLGVDPDPKTKLPDRYGYISYLSQWVRTDDPLAQILRNYTSYPDAYHAPALSSNKDALEKIPGRGHFPSVATGCLAAYLGNATNPTLQVVLK